MNRKLLFDGGGPFCRLESRPSAEIGVVHVKHISRHATLLVRKWLGSLFCVRVTVVRGAAPA